MRIVTHPANPPRILFLITPSASPHNDNHLRLPLAFRVAGWQVSEVTHDQVGFTHQHVCIDGDRVDPFDWVWPVGFGPRRSYARRLDAYTQARNMRWVNHPLAWQTLHSKLAWTQFSPPTVAAADPASFIEQVVTSDHWWVIKPEAGSLGRHVIRVNKRNVAAMCRQLREVENQDRWLLQPYIEAVASGEVRTLVAGQQIIGSYLRLPAASGLTNLALGAQVQPISLNKDTKQLVDDVQQQLLRAGIRFASIDTVGDWLMEVNIANPGGLQTLSELYQTDVTRRVVQALSEYPSHHD